MSLQQKLDGLKQGFQSSAPREVLEVMARALKELSDSGILDRAAGEGDRAPGFRLLNARGKAVDLEERLTKGPVVLGFYRGRW